MENGRGKMEDGNFYKIYRKDFHLSSYIFHLNFSLILPPYDKMDF
jgi:hypothetical protein